MKIYYGYVFNKDGCWYIKFLEFPTIEVCQSYFVDALEKATTAVSDCIINIIREGRQIPEPYEMLKHPKVKISVDVDKLVQAFSLSKVC